MKTQALPNRALKNASFLVILALSGMQLATSAEAAIKPTTPAQEPDVVKLNMSQTSTESVCSGSLSNPTVMTLPIGKSTLINLPEPIASRTVGNQSILQAKLISPQTLYVLGLDLGATNMIIQGKSGHCLIVDVAVSIDPESLQKSLNELLPEEKNIKVSALSDSVVLTGTVENALAANYVVEIASAYVRRFVQPVPTGASNSTQGGNQNQQNSMMTRNTDAVNPRVVNMLSVNSQQQVMLEVKVAEVSKSLIDKLGASFGLSGNVGSWKYSILTDFLATTASSTGGAISGVKSATKFFDIDAQKQDGLVKILAEPTVMAISGQEGSFLAGGKIFIPVAQNNTGTGTTITLEEKEFGVGVKFTPTVLSGGRINLRVAPEVSELNKEGVGITATGLSGTAILPAFTTRKAATTVQLMDGQSFAIGGLIKNNTTTNIKAFPILGELPVIGALFRSTDFQKDKTELVFIVTPRLVKPFNSNQDIRLPTDRYQDPTRRELFLNGRMEGKLPADAPPPVPAPNADAIKPNEAKQPQGGFDIQ